LTSCRCGVMMNAAWLRRMRRGAASKFMLHSQVMLDKLSACNLLDGRAIHSATFCAVSLYINGGATCWTPSIS
jgi:hypothetical protein